MARRLGAAFGALFCAVWLVVPAASGAGVPAAIGAGVPAAIGAGVPTASGAGVHAAIGAGVPTASGAGVHAARGAGGPAPLAGLIQARHELGLLAVHAPTPAARKQLGRADIDLAPATAPSLWIDPGHVVAPPGGASVFADTRAALLELARISPRVLPRGRASGIEGTILAADRGLAVAAIRQAAGGPGGLLVRAAGMILSGDRWSVTSRFDLGAVQYGVAWQSAFEALTHLVVGRAAFVPPAALARTATAALRNAAIAPAGVHSVSGRGVLQRGGKPEVLFVGLESCRFCAIERWGLVVALSRFGTFSNLQLSQSATTSPPVARSFTFVGSRYVSPYLTFEPVELFGNVPRLGDGFQPLQRLTPPQRALFRGLDPAGSSPFVDVANRFADVGATVSPRLLGVSSWGALASSVRNAKSVPGQSIAATAEVLTAEICQATGGTPASVCGSAVVQDYSSRLARFGGRGGGCSVAEAGSGLQPLVRTSRP